MTKDKLVDEYDRAAEKEIKRRRKWLEKWWGPPCEEFCTGCPNCEMWKSQYLFEERA